MFLFYEEKTIFFLALLYDHLFFLATIPLKNLSTNKVLQKLTKKSLAKSQWLVSIKRLKILGTGQIQT